MAQAAPQSLFTAGLDGCSFEEQVAMVRQRAELEHQRLSEGRQSYSLTTCCVTWLDPLASGCELMCSSDDNAAVRVQAWQPPPRRSRRRSSGGGSWQQRLMLRRVRVVVTDIAP